MTFLNKKNIVILTVGLSLFAGVSGVWFFKSHPRYYYKIKSHLRSILKEAAPLSFKSNLKRNPYSLHQKAARKNGNKTTNNNINQFIKNEKLVKVKSNEGFKINRLTYSRAVLTPTSLNVLKRIGDSFAKKTKTNEYFTVTSLTRTVEQQKNLSRNNRNATKNISTHSYGVSFDISYTRFNGDRGRNSRLQKILEDILIKFQKQGEIYVLMEKNSTCYHITVRK